MYPNSIRPLYSDPQRLVAIVVGGRERERERWRKRGERTRGGERGRDESARGGI